MDLTDRPATTDEYFQRAWSRGDDPWEHGTRWYEARKYGLTVAALPRARYRRSFEPGCGSGFLTRLLAQRSEEHVAMERHPRGVLATRRRCADQPSLSVVEGIIPDDWPLGLFDLIVLSEVLYYLDEASIEQTLTQAHAALVPGGHLVAVHYRPRVAEHAWTGDEVHERLRSRSGWQLGLELTEPDFRLDVLSR